MAGNISIKSNGSYHEEHCPLITLNNLTHLKFEIIVLKFFLLSTLFPPFSIIIIYTFTFHYFLPADLDLLHMGEGYI